MAKRPDFEPWESAKGWVVNVPPSMTAAGKRSWKYFQSETAAKKFAQSALASHSTGIRGSVISATVALQAMEAMRILSGSGISLPAKQITHFKTTKHKSP